MKKILTLLLVLVAATGTANAEFYLSFTDNDTLRLSPNYLGWYFNMPVVAEFDNGVCDHWRMDIIYTNKLSWNSFHHEHSANGPEYGMNIPYIKSDGSDAIYEAPLTTVQGETGYDTNRNMLIIESSTNEYGFWDPNHNGNYVSYGLVKWGPGHNDRMLDIHFRLENDCTGDSIVINGTMSCTFDWRYPTSLINYYFHKVIHLIVAYILGDVNGDEVVNLNDVTALIDYLNGTIDLNQYQLDAADVNHNGNVTIADVTVLIDLLIGQGTYNVEDFEDM